MTRFGFLSLAALPACLYGAVADLPRHPLYFEPNLGQHGPRAIRFTGQQGRLQVALGQNGARLTLRQGDQPAQLGMRLAGGSPSFSWQGESARGDVTHYYLSQTETYPNVPHYDRVRATAVYPGIDWVWHGASDTLEYDFVVAPGANPARIGLAFAGAMPRLENGDLVLVTAAGPLRHRRPVAYQEIGGRRVAVPAAYRLADGHVAFTVGAYDKTRALVIDPAIVFSTFVGGPLADTTNDFHALLLSTARVACSTVGTIGGGSQAVVTRYQGASTTTAVFGSAANQTTCDKMSPQRTGGSFSSTAQLHIGGTTDQASFPRVGGGPQAVFGGGRDAVLLILNATTLQVEQSSTIGGSGNETLAGIELGETGDLYLAGSTTSTNFPTSSGVFQPTFQGGASDGYIYRRQQSNGEIRATYVGGNGADTVLAFDVPFFSENGAVMCVGGQTTSTNLTTSPGAPRAALENPLGGGWITCLLNSTFTAGGSQGILRTYFGGAGGDDRITGIVTDGANYRFVGATNSSGAPNSPTGLPLTVAGSTASPLDGFQAWVQLSNGGASSTLLYSALLGSPAGAITTPDNPFLNPLDVGIALQGRPSTSFGAPSQGSFLMVSPFNSTGPTGSSRSYSLSTSAAPTSLRWDSEGVDNWLVSARVTGPFQEIVPAGGSVDFDFAGTAEGWAADVCLSPACGYSVSPFTLTVGTGGVVEFEPFAYQFPGVIPTAILNNTITTLTAVPNPGAAFYSWSAGCLNPQPSPYCAVTPPLSAVSASFGDPTITVSLAGTGTGRVFSTPSGMIDCPGTCAAGIFAGSIALTASANSGSAFTGWTGCPTPSGATCTVPAIPDALAFVTANFSGPGTLTVALQGTGSGTVTSSPAGINCPGACVLPLTTPVTLTATATAGSQFTGWVGCPSATGSSCAVPATFIGTVRAGFSPATSSVNLIAARTAIGQTLAARVWRFRIDNTGSAAATSVNVGPLSLTQFSGPSCFPPLGPGPITAGPVPASFGSIPAGGSAVFDVTLNLSACTSATQQFDLQIPLSAAGGYSVTRTVRGGR